MEISTINDDYEEAKREAKALYKKIGHVLCPVLGGEKVFFNSIGFRHLIQKRGIQRSKYEQKRRFLLLPYAEKILNDPKATALHEEKDIVQQTKWRGRKRMKISHADYWIFTAQQNSHFIRLVLRQFRGGQKHFLTIYNGKKKEKPLP